MLEETKKDSSPEPLKRTRPYKYLISDVYLPEL
jgi:hypothetical protein